MARAHQLARAQDRRTSPNPLVGCVIVSRGRILAEGAFRRDGERHAEIEAISRLSEADRPMLPSATAYVSLEPCSIHGRTPPCADRLVKEGVGRVVVAAIDRTPGVCGQGLAVLRRGGAEVIFGTGQHLGVELGRARSIFATEHRPYIVLKQAVSSDGFVGRSEGPIPVSCAISHILSHQWRSEADVILIGARTLLIDRPALSTRNFAGPSPDVVVFDPRGGLQPTDFASLRVPATGIERARRIFWARSEADGEPSVEIGQVTSANPQDERSGVEMLRLSAKHAMGSLLTELHRRRVGRLLVEGGPATLRKFVDAGVWDEYREFRSTKPLRAGKGETIPATVIEGDVLARYSIGEDELRIVRPTPHCSS